MARCESTEATLRPVHRPRGRRTPKARVGTPTQTSIPTHEELVAAASSLLHDELRPYGRLLRKRLDENSKTHSAIIPLAQLRVVCEECPGVTVEQEGEAEWFLIVAGLNNSVVDIYSEEGDFSEDFWNEAAAYLSTPNEIQLGTGGRYVCARNLMEMNPPFLQGLSLGKVTQFVQIAMSTRKLLGYCHGSIVPYAQSDALLKEQCAEQHVLSRDAGAPLLCSWDILRHNLRTILEECSSPTKARGGVPLSNIKRLIRNRFYVELSETALGHKALADVFKDSRLQHICSLRLLDNGYYLYLSPDAASENSPTDSENLQSQTAGIAKPTTLTSTTPCSMLGNGNDATFPTLESLIGDASTRPVPRRDASERVAVLAPVVFFVMPTALPAFTPTKNLSAASDGCRTASCKSKTIEAGLRVPPTSLLRTPLPFDNNVKFASMINAAVTEDRTASTAPPSCASDASSRESSRSRARVTSKRSGEARGSSRRRATGSSRKPVQKQEVDSEFEVQSPIRIRNTFIEIDVPSDEDVSPRRRATSVPRFFPSQ